MKKKNDRFAPIEIITDLDESVTQELSPTTIIEDEEDVYPHCVLPDNFFEFALARQSRGAETSLLSIDSWDGREILHVLRKQ